MVLLPGYTPLQVTEGLLDDERRSGRVSAVVVVVKRSLGHFALPLREEGLLQGFPSKGHLQVVVLLPRYELHASDVNSIGL